jgi:NAD(P)-dependent dehydrogenase (short-subunit alcohol dehydrogenase family)
MGDKWTAERIPDQSGRVALVTGANSGLGLAAGRELAKAGAHVVVACRNTTKGRAAVEEIREAAPRADPELEALDLADLASIGAFAERFATTHDALDLLILNAGVMAPPRRETKDGFELQFGTNHLGHFALAGLLFPLLEGRDDARVVTVASIAHRTGRINFDDLQGERRYFRWAAYGQAKLANLIFAVELDRRLRAAGSTVKSLAAHPGYAATNLQTAVASWYERPFMLAGNLLFAQSGEMGALPILYAATEPGVEGGMYFGPDGIAEARGHPQVVGMTGAARDEETARRLWEVSEELTGVEFAVGAPAA